MIRKLRETGREAGGRAAGSVHDQFLSYAARQSRWCVGPKMGSGDKGSLF